MNSNYRVVQAFNASNGHIDDVDPNSILIAAASDMVNLSSVADSLGCSPHELQTVFDDLKPDYK